MVLLNIAACFLKIFGCHCCLKWRLTRLAEDMLNDEERNFSDETKRILEEEISQDSYTLIVTLTGPGGFIQANKNPPTIEDIKASAVDCGWKKDKRDDRKWLRVRVREFIYNVSKRFRIILLGEDDLLGSQFTLKQRLSQEVFKADFVFPMNDLDYICKDKEVTKRVMDEMDLAEGKAMPTSYNTDFNMETDESFSRIFFYGIGCVLLEKQETVSDSEYGPIEVDMPLHTLPVRKLYRALGARVHFSKDQKVTAIFDYEQGKLFQPGEEGWDNAKLLAKVTCFTLTTAQEHLVWTHWLVSNNATREMCLNLTPTHPIRRLLAIFTFRSNVVNAEAFDLLMPKLSMLHRSCAFSIEAMNTIFDSAFTNSTIFKPFPEKTYNSAVQELIDAGKFPYATQFSEYYELIRKFVKSWLKKADDRASDAEAKAFYNAMKATTKGQSYELPEFGDDALVNLCTTIMFTVTAYHELIGHVVDYTNGPSKAGFRITKNDPSEIDLQSLLLAGVISASTSKRMPMLMSPFKNFFGVEGAPAWERDLWDGFVKELEKQSEKVQAENAKADFEWKYGDPSRFECSVSV